MSRLRSEAAYHQRLRDLIVAFSRGISSNLSLDQPLQTLAADANDLVGARRLSIWLHQRRARELTLAACSDDAPSPLAGAIATNDADAAPARGLRLERPAVVGEESTMLLAPLRGRRRALGTLVFEGPFTAPLGTSQIIELTHELTRQISSTIENIQLLDEVLHQRRLLEDTFNSLVDLVVVTDDRFRVVQMNEAFIARLGLRRQEMMERRLDGLVGPELAAWAAGDEANDDAGGAPRERTHQFDDARLGGTFVVTMTPLINEAGKPAGHVLIARDITHQTRLEKERETLRERLAQSEKLAALGQFVAGIAHEMNNPLQGVLGYLELMIETADAAKPLQRDLRRIYREADRAAKIVRNLLTFTGAHRIRRRRLSIARVLSRALTSRSSALKKARIDVVRNDARDLPMISGDPLLLHQAFLNVLINAEHAISSEGVGGTLEVRSFTDAARAKVITTIQDSGPGIPADVLSRIFDPFFTTKEVGKGTGLGLAITYGIVQDHDGAIYAGNATGGGAIFTIELPTFDQG